jgi:hypothetical protein
MLEGVESDTVSPTISTFASATRARNPARNAGVGATIRTRIIVKSLRRADED